MTQAASETNKPLLVRVLGLCAATSTGSAGRLNLLLLLLLCVVMCVTVIAHYRYRYIFTLDMLSNVNTRKVQN